MIFFHPQLMRDDKQLRLFVVSNPTAFKRFEDHLAAIEIQLFTLVEKAIEDKETPSQLIEDYLGVYLWGKPTPEELVGQIMNSFQMQAALEQLEENWESKDDSLTDSLNYRTGSVTKEQAFEAYGYQSLRNYLEVLAEITPL